MTVSPVLSRGSSRSAINPPKKAFQALVGHNVRPISRTGLKYDCARSDYLISLAIWHNHVDSSQKRRRKKKNKAKKEKRKIKRLTWFQLTFTRPPNQLKLVSALRIASECREFWSCCLCCRYAADGVQYVASMLNITVRSTPVIDFKLHQNHSSKFNQSLHFRIVRARFLPRVQRIFAESQH